MAPSGFQEKTRVQREKSGRHSNPIYLVLKHSNPIYLVLKFLKLQNSCRIFDRPVHAYGAANMQKMHVNCKTSTQKIMKNNEKPI